MKGLSRWKTAPANERKPTFSQEASHPKVESWYLKRPSISSFGSDPSLEDSVVVESTPKALDSVAQTHTVSSSIYQRLYDEASKLKSSLMKQELVREDKEIEECTFQPLLRERKPPFSEGLEDVKPFNRTPSITRTETKRAITPGNAINNSSFQRKTQKKELGKVSQVPLTKEVIQTRRKEPCCMLASQSPNSRQSNKTLQIDKRQSPEGKNHEKQKSTCVTGALQYSRSLAGRKVLPSSTSHTPKYQDFNLVKRSRTTSSNDRSKSCVNDGELPQEEKKDGKKVAAVFVCKKNRSFQ